MNGYKIVLLKAIFMLYRLPESERVCSGICIVNNTTLSRSQAINATDSVIEAISHSLIKGESVFIRGFATIKAIVTAPKKARNINKGTAVTIPAQHSAKLVLSKELKERMNKK
jgi:nucleoid DNA-binding protein